MKTTKGFRYLLFLTLILTILLTSFEVSLISCTEFGEIKVLSFRGLLSTDGSIYVVFGEIYNGANKFLGNVIVEISLLNEHGGLIARINATSSLSVIPPKRRSPFIGYYWGDNRNLVRSASINRIIYDYSEERPCILAFTYCDYSSGSLLVHVLNNYTLVVGREPIGTYNATNNIKVVAALYFQNKIVGTSAGYLNLDWPGLLPDMDTSEGGRPPISVDFAYPFNETEVFLADKIVVSVESRDFAAQYQLIGLIKNGLVESDGWTQVYKEELSNVSKDGAPMKWDSILTLAILTILSVIFATLLLLRGRKETKRARRRLRE